jgi:hypothetical protein
MLRGQQKSVAIKKPVRGKGEPSHLLEPPLKKLGGDNRWK